MPVKGQILTPNGFVAGTLHFGEYLEGLERGPAPERYVLPGFIDTHVHGGGGGDTMDGTQGVETLARLHVQHGTTTLLPTTMTAPWPDIMAALRAVAAVRARGVEGGADIPGAHLEGPFISAQRLGAQPAFSINPTADHVREILNLDVVRIVTLAPELPGAADAAETFARHGVRVSLGHTTGAYEDARHVMNRVRAAGGTVAATHLFNAMGTLSGRDPGVLGAFLADREAFGELILDLHHLHPAAFLTAHAALGSRLMLITDAIRATGRGDGPSELGGQAVQVQGGAARLANGTLAGSVLTQDAALRNAVACGATLEDAARMLSQAPAHYLGLQDRGVLRKGFRADIVVLDANLHVQEVWLKGTPVKCQQPTH